MSNFQPYHGENKLHVWKDDDEDVRFVWVKHPELDFYSARLLKQQSAVRHVALLGHIIMIKTNHALLLLLIAACLEEKQHMSLLILLNAVSGEETNTNFIVFGLTRQGLEPTIYRTRDEHDNNYTIDVVSNL